MKPTVSDSDTERPAAALPAQVELARGGVQRGEQLVGGIGARLDQRVEQRGLARVGVADQRDVEGPSPFALAALRVPLLLDLLQPLARALDRVADHPPVQLDLLFTRAAAHARAAGLAFQVGPPAHQPRAHVLQPGELDLQLALVAARALAEDFEDEQRAVVDRQVQVPLQVALLAPGSGPGRTALRRRPVSSASALISSALPLPTNSAASGALRLQTTRATGCQARRFAPAGPALRSSASK